MLTATISGTWVSRAILDVDEKTVAPNTQVTISDIRTQTVCGDQDNKLFVFGGRAFPKTVQVITLDKPQGITLSGYLNVIEKKLPLSKVKGII